MERLRAFAYSAAVTLAVFVYLALPTLRELYGPAVNLPVYGLVAVLAGGLTWALLADPAKEGDAAPESGLGLAGSDDEGDVDEEIAQLRDEL